MDGYLSELSPKDKPWDAHRFDADKVRDCYRVAGYESYAARINQCSKALAFALAANEVGELFFRLESAMFCRCRHCPICQWRRSLMWLAKFFKVLPAIQQDYPNYRFIFLTLTVKNCQLSELRDTLAWMHKAWILLTKRKAFPAVGWVKSVEVTKPKEPLTAHPHFHCILMVPSSYFSGAGKYLKHEKWRELWKSCLRVDYDPIVHISVVKPKVGQSAFMLEAALRETLKYSVKPSDLVNDPEWLAGLTQQLHKTRAIALGGVFKKYLSDDEPEDLIHADDLSESERVSDDLLLFTWRESIGRYVHKKQDNKS
uniref:Uncharacterized protein n=1 Tax=Tolypothrix bouteillei VB521301 TaxID=1479485 RepID=A0A0C1QX02_9CYAN